MVCWRRMSSENVMVVCLCIDINVRWLIGRSFATTFDDNNHIDITVCCNVAANNRFEVVRVSRCSWLVRCDGHRISCKRERDAHRQRSNGSSVEDLFMIRLEK